MRGALLCCALLPAMAMAAGVLKLSHAEIWLRGDGRTSRLYAENIGDTTLYLEVEQRLLRNPGQQPEELTPIAEVRHPTLLVAPVRLALAPGQRAPVTMKELARPDSPQVWRVTFRPREKLLAAQDPAQEVAAPLVVSIGYGVLIYQVPAR
ncbi:hypothetical protein KDH83_22565 [Achromobacter sp. Marseille-Q0513]|uniref:hypothetical protein n=1 Tax=Achromobacter sp. Marseille-Q0513 TaxID=2829161 RepID=UPI001B9F9252|nr:hypothetical protein [Achromobacter sp. Marseille-Q0513]MBR8656098.1 hypothetical protein [Achromobacter sp. Marseille-Q0513]